MYILINYCGEIKVNPLGMVYDFPHYSTFLGGILATYHKENNTPLYPRIDMFKLSSELNLALAVGFEKNTNKLKTEMILGTDYSTTNVDIIDIDGKKVHMTSNKYFLKTRKTISSQINQNIYSGSYFLLIKTDNSKLIKSLMNNMISLGTRTQIPNDYKIVGCFNDWDDIPKMNISWITINTNFDKIVTANYLDEIQDEGRFEELGIFPILFSCPYTLDYNFMCTVSQIKWEHLSNHMIQGLYMTFKIKDNLLETNMLDYKILYDKIEINLRKELGDKNEHSK